jgi:hypothetical protein
MLETREGGCHCGRVRFRAEVDLDLLSSCSCSICTKKGILHLGSDPASFELLRGKTALTAYTFGTGVAQHTFCAHCGMHAFYSRARTRTASASMPAAWTTSTRQA